MQPRITTTTPRVMTIVPGRKTEEKEVNTEEEEVKTIINIKEEVLDTINKEQTSISKDIIIWKEFPNENIR